MVGDKGQRVLDDLVVALGVDDGSGEVEGESLDQDTDGTDGIEEGFAALDEDDQPGDALLFEHIEGVSARVEAASVRWGEAEEILIVLMGKIARFFSKTDGVSFDANYLQLLKEQYEACMKLIQELVTCLGGLNDNLTFLEIVNKFVEKNESGFEFENLKSMASDTLDNYKYLAREFERVVGFMEDRAEQAGLTLFDV